MIKITEDFLIELIKLCLTNKDVLEIVRQHTKYHFLPTEEYKKLFKVIFDHFDIEGDKPTIGIVSQRIKDEDTRSLFAKINRANVQNDKEAILKTFEKYLRSASFISLGKEVKELYEQGKEEEAIHLLDVESKKINELSISGSAYNRVFADYHTRQRNRQNRETDTSFKVPTGIPQFDHHTKGGIEKGTALLAIARSGVGKSTLLRWFGYSGAKRGLRGIHFQAEGKREQVEDAYDAMWTAVDIHQVKYGKVPSEKIDDIEKARIQMLQNKGEIHVVAYEQFNAATIAQTRQTAQEIINKYGEIDFIIWDYLELFDPGDGKRYSTNREGVESRKLETARKIINVCTELNVAGFTATQSSNIPKGGTKETKGWNNPDFVITREHIANLKATIDAFAYCISLNQTEDENDAEVIRLWEEKLREYKVNSQDRMYSLVQNRSKGRFVNSKATNAIFWDNVDKKHIDIDNYTEYLGLLKELNEDEIN